MRPLVFHGGLAAYAFYAALGIWGAGEAFLQVRTRAGERDPSYVWMIAGSVVGLWFGFAAFFFGLALVDEPSGFTWFLVVPLALAGVQLITGVALGQGHGRGNGSVR